MYQNMSLEIHTEHLEQVLETVRSSVQTLLSQSVESNNTSVALYVAGTLVVVLVILYGVDQWEKRRRD